MFFGQLTYTIAHMFGDDNCRRDLLSRWVTRPERRVCVHEYVKHAEVALA